MWYSTKNVIKINYMWWNCRCWNRNWNWNFTRCRSTRRTSCLRHIFGLRVELENAGRTSEAGTRWSTQLIIHDPENQYINQLKIIKDVAKYYAILNPKKLRHTYAEAGPSICVLLWPSMEAYFRSEWSCLHRTCAEWTFSHCSQTELQVKISHSDNAICE